VVQPFVSPELAFRLLADANGTAGMPKPESKPRVSLNYRNNSCSTISCGA